MLSSYSCNICCYYEAFLKNVSNFFKTSHWGLGTLKGCHLNHSAILVLFFYDSSCRKLYRLLRLFLTDITQRVFLRGINASSSKSLKPNIDGLKKKKNVIDITLSSCLIIGRFLKVILKRDCTHIVKYQLI